MRERAIFWTRPTKNADQQVPSHLPTCFNAIQHPRDKSTPQIKISQTKKKLTTSSSTSTNCMHLSAQARRGGENDRFVTPILSPKRPGKPPARKMLGENSHSRLHLRTPLASLDLGPCRQMYRVRTGWRGRPWLSHDVTLRKAPKNIEPRGRQLSCSKSYIA